MEYRRLPALDRDVSRIGIGTWAIGGVHWGGTDPAASIDAIHAGLDRGANLIDTAPVYGFGLSEEIVGSAIREHESTSREDVILASKAGLEWEEGRPSSDAFWRNSAPDRIRDEIEGSLQRIQTDYIDIYQVHWPDPDVPFDETANEMSKLKKEGKIRAVGVSNFSPEQMETFRDEIAIDTCQPLYNLFERESQEEVLPYCQDHDIHSITYSVLCRGMLSGSMSGDRDFPDGDVRNQDPKFQSPRFEQYLEAVEELNQFVRETYDRGVHHLAARWALDTGADTVLWGLRTPEQAEPFEQIDGWSLSEEDFEQIDRIYRETIDDPIDHGLPGPPERREDV
jgi:aryl-alcohol dehydrogenase-like predicted oxidoreductase